MYLERNIDFFSFPIFLKITFPNIKVYELAMVIDENTSFFQIMVWDIHIWSGIFIYLFIALTCLFYFFYFTLYVIFEGGDVMFLSCIDIVYKLILILPK